MLINLLCGVQKPHHVVLQHLPNSTPHNYRRHITHKMWCTTFDAGIPHVRSVRGALSNGRPYRDPLSKETQSYEESVAH
jgi:hypothetical protein